MRFSAEAGVVLVVLGIWVLRGIVALLATLGLLKLVGLL